MDTSSVQITELIPQRKPFVFIDALLSCNDNSAETSFKIEESNLLVRSGVLQTSGLIEHIAQSCIAKVGYEAKYINKKDITIGYIGNVHHLKVNRNPKVGETLTTTVVFGDKIGEIQISEVTVRCGNEVIAETSIKTAQDE